MYSSFYPSNKILNPKVPIMEENSLLERELRAAHKERTETASKDVKELKLLLASDGQRDLEMLRSLAPNSPLIANEKKLGSLIELENFEKEYLGKVYTRNMIKDLAVDYKLKFLPATYFKGDMDVVVLSKIRQFAKDTNTEIDRHTLSSRFFILAPHQCFHLKERERPTPPKPIDPLIFYKISENHYRLIHKWGADFTPLRRLLGWKWENVHNVRTFNFLVQLPVLAVIFCIFFDTTTIVEHSYLLALTIATLSYFIARFRNNELISAATKRVDIKFFTPDNWDTASYDKTFWA